MPPIVALPVVPANVIVSAALGPNFRVCPIKTSSPMVAPPLGIINGALAVRDVGLGYIRLGQPATTLSGGEAQRVKLATELHRPPRKHTIYILDEPTTGLALSDVHQLIDVLLRLRRNGHSVIIIEHHLDVIKCSDWIIDLGPEGGERGGLVIAEGPPDKVAKVPGSYTGQHLKEIISSS